MSARHRDVLVAALERLNLDLDEDEIEYVASGAVEDDERGTTVARDEFVDFSWPVFAARTSFRTTRPSPSTRTPPIV